MSGTPRRPPILGATLAILSSVASLAIPVAPDPAEAATSRPGDGTTSVTAGASCWGIKQQHPNAATGTYWLLTRSMDRPARFVCDMTTNGGGWVLVGRGRDGWTFAQRGQRSPSAVRTTIDGPAAFAPAALSTTTINELLDHADLSALPDGIRLERAIDPAGTARQDYRLHPKGRTWTWSFDAGQLLNRVQIDGTTYLGSNTRDTSASVTGITTNALRGITGVRRLATFASPNHDNRRGFWFGNGVAGGSRAPTNHLWTAASEGSPLPFTRVWLRPRLANGATGPTPIPARGFVAEAKPAALKNRSELARWGVTGYNHVNEGNVTPWHANVLAVKVHGDRVYVGGRFTGVQNGPGATPIAQASLAAFDLDGNWIPTFRPVISGRVWALTVTADGKLIVGGDFASVDGAPDTSGLASLDPLTGRVDRSWRGSATRSGGNAIVRALDSRGGWIYAAGRFNAIAGGTRAPAPITNAVSLSTANGTPGTWRPKIHASAARLQVSRAGDRVYLAGFFNAVNGDTNQGFHAITDLTTGAPVPGIGPFRPSEGSRPGNAYQLAVGELGDDILVGGAEHDFQRYDHRRSTLLDATITRTGGDTQAIANLGDHVYIGCHCMNWIYQGTNSWTRPIGFRSVEPIRMIGRFDTKTMTYDTSWYPNGTKGINDAGIWSIDQDRRRCVWVGGDLIRGAYSGNPRTDYLGGFARFCPTDATPPSPPSRLRVVAGAPGSGPVQLSWRAATDDHGPITYDVYRDDRVIASTSATTYADATASAVAGRHRYTVRAADGRGNRSASPAPIASRPAA